MRSFSSQSLHVEKRWAFASKREHMHVCPRWGGMVDYLGDRGHHVGSTEIKGTQRNI